MLIKFTGNASTRRVVGNYVWEPSNRQQTEVDDLELIVDFLTNANSGFVISDEDEMVKECGVTLEGASALAMAGIVDIESLAGIMKLSKPKAKVKAGKIGGTFGDSGASVLAWAGAAKLFLSPAEKEPKE